MISHQTTGRYKVEKCTNLISLTQLTKVNGTTYVNQHTLNSDNICLFWGKVMK